jgi:hypothetical protein
VSTILAVPLSTNDATTPIKMAVNTNLLNAYYSVHS